MRHMDEGLLQAWLDGPRAGLTDEERAAIEEHLDACPACAERVAGLRDSTVRVGDLLGPDAGEGVPEFEAVATRARALGARDRHRRRWVASGWAASIVLALGAGWLANELSRAPAEPAAANEPVAAAAGGSEVDDAIGAGEAEARPATPVEAEAAPKPGGEAARAARDPAVVRGRVTDAGTGRPLQGAQIMVDGTSQGTLSGPDGTFRLALGPRPDSDREAVRLRAELIGYEGEMQALPLARGDTVSTDFRLAPSTVALEAIVVAGGVAPLRVPSFADDPGAWRDVSRAEAAGLAGFPIRTVPGLRVVALHVASLEGNTMVRVVQSLGDSARLTLVQAARPIAFEDDTGGEAVATRAFDGELFVVGRAPVAADSVAALLSRIR